MKKDILQSRKQFIKGALLAAFVAIVAPGSLPAQLTNPGFELGTSGWTETGGSGNFTAPTSVVGLYQTVNPASGAHLGLISNDGVATETIAQSFLLPAGPNFLTFSYRFLTDDYNDPFANDAAWATLTPTVGSPLTLFNVSRDDLQAGGAGPLLPGAVYFDIQTIAQGTWQTVTTDLSAYAGQNITLSFNIDNGGDPDLLFESRLGIDNLSVSAVPEPGAAILLAAGFALFVLLKQWRNKSMGAV